MVINGLWGQKCEIISFCTFEPIARTFQHSLSQLEGRNGYLTFVHKASRGIPDQRLKVLTVVHNFDIRSWDGKTPAERLFKQGFSNLFEFVLENVTEFEVWQL